MSHNREKQSQALAGVTVSPPKACVRSCDCSMFCTEKRKYMEY